MRNLGWPVALAGEMADKPFAILKAIPNQQITPQIYDDKDVE